MGKMIYVRGKCKNPKRKPGWKEAAAQEAEWLKKINDLTAFSTTKYKGRVSTSATRSPVVDGTLVGADRPKVGKSLGEQGGAGTKKVPRPEIMYKDDPELLERELKARERKFATAPAYNKGGSILVTDEMMKDITAGTTRRR